MVVESLLSEHFIFNIIRNLINRCLILFLTPVCMGLWGAGDSSGNQSECPGVPAGPSYEDASEPLLYKPGQGRF